MDGWIDGISAVSVVVGAFFFLAGTVGMLRFPDVYCRIHAMTKADNVGLGFIALGVAVRSDTWAIAVHIAAIWLLALASAATICHLLGRHAVESGVPAALGEDLESGPPGG